MMSLENNQKSFELLGVPVLVLGPEGDIVSCNDTAVKILHRTRSELLGRCLGELEVNLLDEGRQKIEDRRFPLNMLDRAGGDTARILFGMEFSIDGLILWLQGVLIRFDEAGTTQYYLTLTDVTSLVGNKAALHQIYQAKSQWETTVDALQDVVTIQTREMKIVRANKKAHDLFGYSFGELQGKKCHEMFLHSSEPCLNCPVSLTVVDGLPHTATIHNEKLQRTFSMSAFPIMDEKGDLNLVVHVARDITQYLHNESEKNRLMAAIEQTSESVVISDKDGVILYVNPAFETTSGYLRSEVTGKNLNVLKSGVHDQSFYKEMWNTLAGKRVWRGRLTNRRKNGALFREDVTISPVLDQHGRIVNYVALKRDVTREELLENQLHQSLKMEALGTLAGGIAHDFNNILSAMIGYGEIAKNRLELDHPARKDLEQMLSGGDRAMDLVKQILTFSRQETYGQFRVFKLQYIVKEIIKLLRPSLPATIELQHEIDMSCGSIFADPGQIYQVIMNLCTNARQAIGDSHGRIILRLSEMPVTDDLPMAGESGHKAFLVFEVSDTGCGMDDETLSRIFDPFFTTKKKEHGTGLGLSVVHGIIKRHRGEIQVSSNPGVGTTFQVFLAVDGRDVREPDQTEPVYCAGHGRIMLVEDESQVVDVVQRMLTKYGYTVQSFTDPIEAVKAFRNDPGCCDLVLTDMLMPSMTGAELAREFLALRENLPIIMMTGYGGNFDKEKAARLGIRELLLKPVKMRELQQIVQKVLNNE